MKQRVVIYIPNFSPYKIVESIPGTLVCRAINDCFKNWGLPKRIKIDNGWPLANTENREIPTLVQLWWIGLGIEIQLNHFGVPQQNGTVEGLQNIGRRWSAPHKYDNIDDYQIRINETNLFQREKFRVRRLGDKTRKESYPKLWENPRKYHAGNFSIQKVFENLSERVWKRLVHSNGVIKFWSIQIYIGKRFRGQKVTITFDPIEFQWVISSLKGELLKTCPKMPFTKKQILEYAGISMNL